MRRLSLVSVLLLGIMISCETLFNQEVVRRSMMLDEDFDVSIAGDHVCAVGYLVTPIPNHFA